MEPRTRSLVRFALLTVCVAGVCFPRLGVARTLSLKEAITYALEHAPGLNTAERQAYIAELQRKNAIASFLPSLDTQAIHGINKASPIPNATDPWQSSVGLTLTEHFYDNGISLLNYDKAKLNRDLAGLNQKQVRDKLCLDVLVDFYAYSVNKQNRDVKDQQLHNLEKQFSTASDQYQQGFKTRADYLRLKTQVQSARIDLVNADATLASSAVELRRVLGGDTGHEEALEFTVVNPEELANDIPEAKATPDQTYAVRIARLQNQINQVGVKVTKRSYYPQLDLSSQSSYLYSNYIQGTSPTVGAGGQFNFNLLLTLTYNIWDWRLRRHNVQIAEAGQLVTENNVTQSLLNSQAILKDLGITFNQLRNQYRLAKDLLALSQENFDLIRQAYQEGKMTYLDLINSLNSLYSAKTTFLNAAYGLAQNIARYHFYQGDLYATIPR